MSWQMVLLRKEFSFRYFCCIASFSFLLFFFFSVKEFVVFPCFGFAVFDSAFWYSFFVVKFTVVRKKKRH